MSHKKTRGIEISYISLYEYQAAESFQIQSEESRYVLCCREYVPLPGEIPYLKEATLPDPP